MSKFIALWLLVSPYLMAATFIPFERETPRVNEYSYILSNNQHSSFYNSQFGVDKDENRYWRGFSFYNVGPNDIVTTEPLGLDNAFREFFFLSDDHSQRDSYLWVTDYNGSGRTSDYLETILYFLPRKNQMHVEEVADRLVVTLTTGEEVILASKNRTIISGILSEEAVDLNPDRSQRKQPRVHYKGKGLVIRSDSRGSDPRLSSSVQILKEGLKPCKLPGKVFWTQEGFPKFRFVSDEEAYKVIAEKCGDKFLD
jgi:hypothetical protein